jgi:heme-degrading monooxygenase HmoA
MHARVTRYDIPAERLNDAVESFGAALDEIRGLDGFREGYLLIDREGDCATTVTFWESRAAMDASAVTASRLRNEAAREADGVVASSHNFEVAETAVARS